MSRVVGNTFKGMSILIDGSEYYECTFVRCTIRFGGKLEGLALVGCKFVDCTWELVYEADSTIEFLAQLYSGFGSGDPQGRDIVEGIFSSIRNRARHLVIQPQSISSDEVVGVPAVSVS